MVILREFTVTSKTRARKVLPDRSSKSGYVYRLAHQAETQDKPNKQKEDGAENKIQVPKACTPLQSKKQWAQTSDKAEAKATTERQASHERTCYGHKRAGSLPPYAVRLRSGCRNLLHLTDCPCMDHVELMKEKVIFFIIAILIIVLMTSCTLLKNNPIISQPTLEPWEKTFLLSVSEFQDNDSQAAILFANLTPAQIKYIDQVRDIKSWLEHKYPPNKFYAKFVEFDQDEQLLDYTFTVNDENTEYHVRVSGLDRTDFKENYYTAVFKSRLQSAFSKILIKNDVNVASLELRLQGFVDGSINSKTDPEYLLNANLDDVSMVFTIIIQGDKSDRDAVKDLITETGIHAGYWLLASKNVTSNMSTDECWDIISAESDGRDIDIDIFYV